MEARILIPQNKGQVNTAYMNYPHMNSNQTTSLEHCHNEPDFD